MQKLYKGIGEKIRKIRTEKGLTLEQLSEKCNRDWSFLSQIERGKDIPSIETIYLIANALHTPISELFTTEEPLKPTKYDSTTMKIISMIEDKKPEYKRKLAKILHQIIEK